MAPRSLTSMMRSSRSLMRLSAMLVGPRILQMLNPKPVRPARGRAKPGRVAPAPANPGQLEQIVHVPPGLRRGAPLVVVLHGCEQEPLALAEASGWRVLADRLGMVLLMPRQVQDNNRHRCFNWYQTKDIMRDHGEVASIHAMVMGAIALHRCDPSRVFVTGLSAGGAMAACLLSAYPECFAGGAIVAGLPAGAASGVVGAMTRMAGHGSDLTGALWAARARALGPVGYAGPLPQLSVWHGTADQVVAVGNAHELVAQWTALAGRDLKPVAEPRAGAQHTVWRDDQGRPCVELWLVDGMGHGYPAAGALTPHSTVAPTPISAAQEIVEFWGLMPNRR